MIPFEVVKPLSDVPDDPVLRVARFSVAPMRGVPREAFWLVTSRLAALDGRWLACGLISFTRSSPRAPRVRFDSPVPAPARRWIQAAAVLAVDEWLDIERVEAANRVRVRFYVAELTALEQRRAALEKEIGETRRRIAEYGKDLIWPDGSDPPARKVCKCDTSFICPVHGVD